MNSKGANRAVFDAKQFLRPASVRMYRDLQGRAYWSADRLQEYSLRKMRELVEHAVSQSPFYAEHLGSEREDLTALPLLTRAHVRDCFEGIRARNIRESRGRIATTGGSTGVPLKVLKDKESRFEVIGWRALKTWGVHPGDNVAVINRQHRTTRETLINNMMWYPTRRVLLNAGMMTPDAMREFVRVCHKVRPRVVVGYAGAILAFVGFLETSGLRIPAPDVIWVTASPLTGDQRQRIGAAFGAPVFDQYGSEEVNWIAAECRHHCGLHVQSDCVVVEILDDDGSPVPAGTWGRIVITDLRNYLFPLIRYEIGDVGRFLEGDCPCGSALPRLDHIQGRIVDVFRFADGTILGSGLASIFNDTPKAVREFRLHQVDMDTIILYCIPQDNRPETLASIEKVAGELQSRVGNRAKIELKYVDQLDHYRGKTRFVISDVPEQGTSR